MRKVSAYIAVSLNGKIAKKDGSVDWLESIPNPDKSDYGYKDFYASIDTTIQGSSTYNQVMGWGIEFPYAGKKNYVFTRKSNQENTEYVDFISDNHVAFIQQLKEQSGSGIWVIGGGQINTLFLNNKLLDEIILFVMPIILNDGIDLFGSIPKETNINLLESKAFSNGVVELRYGLK